MHSPTFGSRFFSVSFARLRAYSRKKQAKIRKSFHLRKSSYSFHAYTRAQSDFCQLIVANILTYMRFSVSPPSSFSHAAFHVAATMHRPNLGGPSSSGLSPALRVSAAVSCFRRYSAVHHFVYAILFKSLCLLRLHLMQASVLPSFVAFITFGYHPDNGSMRSAASIYAWHIYMPSRCFPLNFERSRIFFELFVDFICKFHLFLLPLQAKRDNSKNT